MGGKYIMDVKEFVLALLKDWNYVDEQTGRYLNHSKVQDSWVNTTTMNWETDDILVEYNFKDGSEFKGLFNLKELKKQVKESETLSYKNILIAEALVGFFKKVETEIINNKNKKNEFNQQLNDIKIFVEAVKNKSELVFCRADGFKTASIKSSSLITKPSPVTITTKTIKIIDDNENVVAILDQDGYRPIKKDEEE